jgi:uncharacterized protein YsxB (DUF464 family)
MIRLQVYERQQRIERFSVTGHSGYAKAGSDIVCAAVSALVYTAINSVEKLVGVELMAVDDGDTLECTVLESTSDREVQLLIQSMMFGIEQTAAEYPRHIQIKHYQID